MSHFCERDHSALLFLISVQVFFSLSWRGAHPDVRSAPHVSPNNDAAVRGGAGACAQDAHRRGSCYAVVAT